MFLIARVAVRSVRRFSASFSRVELAGAQLAEFGVDGPTYDQRIKIIFPGPAGRLPELDQDDWWQQFQALPEAERGSMRTYTIRAVTGRSSEPGIIVDFVLHPGAHGPGSDWAAAARPGDEVLVVVPRKGQQGGGIEWAPPADTSRLLLVGDETAVPAVASILASLPSDATGTAVLEVPLPDDVQRLTAPAAVDIRWVVRYGAPVGALANAVVRELFAEPIAAARIQADRIQAAGAGAASVAAPQASAAVDPDLWETPSYSSSGDELAESDADAAASAIKAGRYVWIAGEAGMVTGLRRHLVTELGLPRRQVAFMGYWREGVAMRG